MAKRKRSHNAIPPEIRPERFVQRNRLISMLLQDRGVVRMLCAPHGFGKTVLAYEYATRMFSARQVCWIDAESPDFLLALDEGTLMGVSKTAEAVPGLIVIDGLPWLHEQRAASLAHRIDEMLCRGAEVLITALPSTDCLEGLQPDRLLIGARDLFVTEQEFTAAAETTHETRARMLQEWRAATDSFMGRVPCVVWGADRELTVVSCLRGFFEESLSFSLHQCALVILLLERGSMGDLERIGAKPCDEDVRVLLRDYPFLGAGSSFIDFKIPAVPIAIIKEALEGNALSMQIESGAVTLAERVLAVLLERDDVRRVVEVLEAFCPDERCAPWLMARGWDLLDLGEVELVETLFDRCPLAALEEEPTLQAIKSWACGLQGDELEARHFAHKILRRNEEAEGSCTRAERLCAYLSLAAFDEGATAMYGKEIYAPQGEVMTPVDFLACAVDLCTDLEVSRALCIDNTERISRLERQREAAGDERAELLIDFFTQHHDRFKETLAYRMALHLLQFVDNVRLRKLLQTLGCDVIVSVRRRGLHRYSEALLVSDLWKNGYFGLGGPGGSARDITLLDGAAEKLRGLAEQRGAEMVDIPWDFDRETGRDATGRHVELRFRDNIEIMHVRMLGGFEVVKGETFFRESEFKRKGRIILAMLVLHQGRDVPRNKILEELWGGFSRVRALDNFYAAWGTLASLIGEGPYLERNGEFCCVNTRYVLSDVAELERISRQLLTGHADPAELLDIYARIEALYRGDLVPTETESAYIRAQRERFKSMFVDAMISASAHALQLNDARLALWFARKAMESDDRREDVYFAMIRAQMAAGQRCSAIRTYFECQQFLRDELGLDPSNDTKSLYDRLISADPSLSQLDANTFGI